MGQTEHWFQGPAAGLGQSHTLQLEVCQVHAHGRPVGGSLHRWFNSRWQLEANTESRLCSSVQILRRPLPPQIAQLPRGHSNLSCRGVCDGGLLLLILGLYRRAGCCRWRELRNTLGHQVPEAGAAGCMNPSLNSTGNMLVSGGKWPESTFLPQDPAPKSWC